MAKSYWSIVENRRGSSQRVVQRQVLYLGEINDSQKTAWCRCIEVFEEPRGEWHQVVLFPEDRQAPELAHEVVHVRLSELQVKRPRQWGACWLSGELRQQLQLDDFWRERLGVSREGTDWLDVLKTLVSYRLISPGSEWRLHREWYLHSAMTDLLGRSGEAMELQSLYRCQDTLLAHKAALFSFLRERWQELFHAEFEVLLYDLTSTYFECDPPTSGKRRFGYSRDKRPDCVQVIIALVVTPDGLPLAYEVMAGNTSEKTTLKSFLGKIEKQYGQAKRVWVMDRGIPTEEQLKDMRDATSPVAYLSSGDAAGSAKQAGEAVSRTALGAGQTVCGSEAAASRGRTLHFGSQRGTSAEITCHPPASAQTSVGLASGTARPGADARRVAAETGSGQSRGGPRLWSGRSASAEAGAAGQRRDVRLLVAQGQATASLSPGRSLSAALEST